MDRGCAILLSYHHPRGQCRANAQRQHRAPRPLLFGTPPVGFLATNSPVSTRSTITFILQAIDTLLSAAFRTLHLGIVFYHFFLKTTLPLPDHRPIPGTYKPAYLPFYNVFIARTTLADSLWTSTHSVHCKGQNIAQSIELNLGIDLVLPVIENF
ncbi:hypothetical protein C8J57DRAFT_1511605 [Mycena rebaudengoi]|nr:hypothetical protein C8J57DRAFT_1511605 [Mycena rebaudengoi]